MREEQNEQLAEETNKKLHSCNLILHGVVENTIGDNDQAKHCDEEYITKFIEALGLHTDYKSAYRLGKIDGSGDQSKRPIKVMMQSEEHKDRIMANLKELKGEEQYKGISVTDDYTIKDRNMIKEWIEKAKKANEEPT